MKILDILLAPVRALFSGFQRGGVFEAAGAILSNPVYPNDLVAFRASPSAQIFAAELTAPLSKCRICGSAGVIIHDPTPAPMLPKGEWRVQCMEFEDECHNTTTPTGNQRFAVEAWNMLNP